MRGKEASQHHWQWWWAHSIIFGQVWNTILERCRILLFMPIEALFMFVSNGEPGFEWDLLLPECATYTTAVSHLIKIEKIYMFCFSFVFNYLEVEFDIYQIEHYLTKQIHFWPCEESTDCSMVCGYISCYICCSLLPQAKIIYEDHGKKTIYIFFCLKTWFRPFLRP